MNRMIKVFGCFLLIYSTLLQFNADTVFARSGNVILKVRQVTKKNSNVRVKVVVNNNTSKEISAGAGYTLQKKSGNGWEKIKAKKNASTPSFAYMIESGKKKSLSFNLRNSFKKSDLKKGKYRIGISVNNKIKYARFTI